VAPVLHLIFQLNAKFVEEFHSGEMAFGGPESFFKGLEGLIGPPNPNLLQGMRAEHRRQSRGDGLSAPARRPGPVMPPSQPRHRHLLFPYSSTTTTVWRSLGSA